MDHAIWAEGLVKRFGETTALAGVDLAVRTGTVLGPARPQRRGQDHRGADARHPAAARRRPGHRRRLRRASARPTGCAS